MTLGILFAVGLINRAAPTEDVVAFVPNTPSQVGVQQQLSAVEREQSTNAEQGQSNIVAQEIAAIVDKGFDDVQVLTELQRAVRASDVEDVTRSEPLAILENMAPLQADPVVETNSEKSTSAAAFFANAQEVVSNADCGEDLKALAAQTRIYFPAGGLTPEGSGLIQARVLGQIAATCPEYSLAVKGHSDPSGNSQINLALSKKRAESVISRLKSAGIDTEAFVAIGVGDKEPSTVTGPNETAYYDRRVEFEVVKRSRTASLGGFQQTLSSNVSACARSLESQVSQIRLFYSARSITASPGDLELMRGIAQQVDQCTGTRLRIVGQHSDDIADRESVETGRMRALILMASMIEAGYDSEKLIIAAPSYSVAVSGQPSLPRSRIDFQIISD